MAWRSRWRLSQKQDAATKRYAVTRIRSVEIIPEYRPEVAFRSTKSLLRCDFFVQRNMRLYVLRVSSNFAGDCAKFYTNGRASAPATGGILSPDA